MFLHLLVKLYAEAHRTSCHIGTGSYLLKWKAAWAWGGLLTTIKFCMAFSIIISRCEWISLARLRKEGRSSSSKFSAVSWNPYSQGIFMLESSCWYLFLEWTCATRVPSGGGPLIPLDLLYIHIHTWLERWRKELHYYLHSPRCRLRETEIPCLRLGDVSVQCATLISL
jgi:hypothetical protein